MLVKLLKIHRTLLGSLNFVQISVQNQRILPKYFNFRFVNTCVNKPKFLSNNPFLNSDLRVCVNPARFSQVPSLFKKNPYFADHYTPRNLQTSVADFKYRMPERKPFEKLPKDVIPVNYCLRLQPDLVACTFDGQEQISVKVVEAASKIILNYGACIEVQKASFQPSDGEKTAADIEYIASEEKVVFNFPSPLPVGEGTLDITFSGPLPDSMKGFYRTKYKTLNGEERYSAVTQFEPTDARFSFPCWDEPAIKATFDVTLVVPKDRLALSNMPVKSEAPLDTDPNLKVVTFETTPIMSTYLLAYIVGEYDFVEARDEDGVLVRVYTPLGKKVQGQFALDVAVKTLPFYKKYFKIAYPLPKMDLIALADFAAGAMENWGLVTYRETALLIDPENSSASAKQRVTLVVGHELAHQWFGNLVTMDWWTHLWLNEGFATWIEYLCVDYCYPEFDIWTQFVSQDFAHALEMDGLDNSHAIEVPVGHPSEIDEIFDAISYSKGASVIRMLHEYMGDEDFRKGLNLYLTKFAYKNTLTEDLWGSLEEASDKPVHKLMDTWTSQMGFPTIQVSQTQDGDNRVLTLSQEKYCADGAKGSTSSWMVPISISSSSSPDKPIKKVVMEGKSMAVTLENIPRDDWVKINPGSYGFYRTQYSSDMLDAIIPAIKDKVLPARDRLGLQCDLFALSRSGTVPCTDVLKVVEGYANEVDYTVWNDLSINLGHISILLQSTDYYDHYKEFSKKLFAPAAERLGWDAKEGEGPLDAMLRGLVLARLGRYGDESAITEAKKRFEDHCSGAKSIPADLRNAVYVTVLTHGDDATYDKILELYDKTDLQEEMVRIQRALGAANAPHLITRTLEFALSDKVRAQDAVFVLAGANKSLLGRDMTWQFVQDRWEDLYKMYGGSLFLLSSLVKCTTNYFVTEEKAKEIQAFFEKHPLPSAARTIVQSCENIRLNEKWLARETGPVGEYLKAFK